MVFLWSFTRLEDLALLKNSVRSKTCCSRHRHSTLSTGKLIFLVITSFLLIGSLLTYLAPLWSGGFSASWRPLTFRYVISFLVTPTPAFVLFLSFGKAMALISLGVVVFPSNPNSVAWFVDCHRWRHCGHLQ